jgi:hypothetical protein
MRLSLFSWASRPAPGPLPHRPRPPPPRAPGGLQLDAEITASRSRPATPTTPTDPRARVSATAPRASSSTLPRLAPGEPLAPPRPGGGRGRRAAQPDAGPRRELGRRGQRAGGEPLAPGPPPAPARGLVPDRTHDAHRLRWMLETPALSARRSPPSWRAWKGRAPCRGPAADYSERDLLRALLEPRQSRAQAGEGFGDELIPQATKRATHRRAAWASAKGRRG